MNLLFNSYEKSPFIQPQPDLWTTSVSETIDLLKSNDIDEIKIWNEHGAEDVAIFLRDNPKHCPKKVEVMFLNPMMEIRIKMWLSDKTELVTI